MLTNNATAANHKHRHSFTQSLVVKRLSVDQKSLVRIPPVASLVKCFIYPSNPWEISHWLKGLGG